MGNNYAILNTGFRNNNRNTEKCHANAWIKEWKAVENCPFGGLFRRITAFVVFVCVLGIGKVWGIKVDVNNLADLQTEVSSTGTADTINITADITLTSALNIRRPLTIIGNNHSISGGNSYRVFRIANPTTGNIILKNLIIKNGQANSNGGGIVYIGASVDTLTIDNCTFIDNKTTGSYNGGAIANNYGSAGHIVIINSTLTKNCADGNGGAIANLSSTGGSLTVINSTIAGNTCGGSGGGISGNAYVINSIVIGNYNGSTEDNLTSTSNVRYSASTGVSGTNISSDTTNVFGGTPALNANNVLPILSNSDADTIGTKTGKQGADFYYLDTIVGIPAVWKNVINGTTLTSAPATIDSLDQLGRNRTVHQKNYAAGAVSPLSNDTTVSLTVARVSGSGNVTPSVSSGDTITVDPNVTAIKITATPAWTVSSIEMKRGSTTLTPTNIGNNYSINIPVTTSDWITITVKAEDGVTTGTYRVYVKHESDLTLSCDSVWFSPDKSNMIPRYEVKYDPLFPNDFFLLVGQDRSKIYEQIIPKSSQTVAPATAFECTLAGSSYATYASNNINVISYNDTKYYYVHASQGDLSKRGEDARLKDIQVDGVSISDFDMDEDYYELTVDNSVKGIRITAYPNVDTSSFKIDRLTYDAAKRETTHAFQSVTTPKCYKDSVALEVGSNTIYLRANNGLKPLTFPTGSGYQSLYTLKVTRLSTSKDLRLKTLTVSISGTSEVLSMTPAFNPDSTTYTVNVAATVTSISIGGSVNNSTDAKTPTGFGEYTLTTGVNKIMVVVESKDGLGTPKTYTIQINRGDDTPTGSTNTDATLSTLVVNRGTLTPKFSPTVTDYTISDIATIPQGGNKTINIIALPTQTSAQIKAGSQNGDQTLKSGDNVFKVVVIAPNGSTMHTYTITVKGVVITGNEEIAGDKVWAFDRQLYVSVSEPSQLQAYNIVGMLVLQETIPAGETVHTLPVGMYIVKVNGIARKVIVK
jgi:hypothetical protein